MIYILSLHFINHYAGSEKKNDNKIFKNKTTLLKLYI
jgi:hypothetical protein